MLLVRLGDLTTTVAERSDDGGACGAIVSPTERNGVVRARRVGLLR